MTKIVCLIQARMGSTRFPGKVLADLCGAPVLAHVVRRCRQAKRVDEVVVAAPAGLADLPIANWCLANGVKCLRPPVDSSDVQLRLLIVAQRVQADVIVRVCADSPLVRPEEIDLGVECLLSNHVDYATGWHLGQAAVPVIETKRSCPEVLTVDCLRQMIDERQHVTPRLRRDFKCDVFSILDVEPDTIDTPEDLRRIAELLSAQTEAT